MILPVVLNACGRWSESVQEHGAEEVCGTKREEVQETGRN